MDFHIEDTEQCRELRLTGKLTIEYAQDMQQSLRTFLESLDHLVLNLEGAAEVDITCLQLLCAAHRSCIRSNKRLTIRGMSKEFINSMEVAGFSRNIGCILDVNNSCLWIKNNIPGGDDGRNRQA